MDQSEWIRTVMKHRPDGFDPYVEKHFHTDNGLQYGNWNKFQGQKTIDERSVFPNEIVIDIDTETTEKARKENRKVLTFLDNHGYDYVVADTGGTGFHIHLFFKYEGIDLEQYREYRIALYEYLKAKCSEEVDAETELWDEQPVRFDVSNSKGHLVRSIGGRKASSKNRKTTVLASSLKKEEISDQENVEYPARLPWMLEISKTGTDKADLSIQQIKDKVEEVKKEEKEFHDKEVETEYDTKISGIDDVRNLPASKVLDLIDKDYNKGTNFECPFHSDSNPSANLYEKDGVERLYCFSNSCAENGRAKVWNAVDILVEEGYTFKESLEKLSEKFDIDVQIGYNPNDYFGNNVKGNYVLQPENLADEIIEDNLFKNVRDGGFYVWRDDYWQEVTSSNDIIGGEVDKRLKNETAARHRNNVRDIIKNRESLKIDKEDFEVPEKKIPFKNGVYDLEEDELVDHKPEYNFDFKYEAEYRPEIENNDVERFINTLMPDSEKKQQKLREIAALSLAPWKINQKVPIFYGQGSNGKNQFVKIIWKMLGKESYHKTSARKLQNDNFEMASVVDKQMAFFDEFEDVSKPGELKSLIGDEQQNVREMRKESYTAKTSVFPVFAANELPNPRENSDGFYRRWEIIDFNQQFTSDPDDGNPNKVPVNKLEEEYMHKDAIDAFATSVIKDLHRLIESNELTDEQSTDEVRRVWKRKGNAVYAFIDKYLKQGELPDEDGVSTDDWIKKDELLSLVNSYMETHNNSKVKKHRLTKALDNHPDFRIWKNYRPEAKDGSRPTAYAGLNVDEKYVQDVKLFFNFNAYVSPPLTNINEIGSWFDIVDSDVAAKVLVYLTKKDKEEVTLFELVRKLELRQDDMADVNNCTFIKSGLDTFDGSGYPTYEIDEEAVKAADEKIDISTGEIQRPQSFVEKQIEGWSDNTQKEIEELLEKAAEVGFSKDRIKETIDGMKSEGILYEPEPGKVGKI